MRALLRARPPGFQDSAVNIYFFRFVVWVGSEVWYLRCTLRILQENKPDGSSDAFLWMCKALHDQHGRVVRRSLKDAAILASCHHVVQELDTVWRTPRMAKRAEPFVRLCTKLLYLPIVISKKIEKQNITKLVGIYLPLLSPLLSEHVEHVPIFLGMTVWAVAILQVQHFAGESVTPRQAWSLQKWVIRPCRATLTMNLHRGCNRNQQVMYIYI